MASEIIIILPNHLYPVRIPPKPLSISTFLCMLGPFQPGWNSIANNGNGLVSPTTHVTPSQHSVPLDRFFHNPRLMIIKTTKLLSLL
jgi:hypothetical protein